MDSLFLLTLTISLMFTGGQCHSSSMSCSTVNGRTVCESQEGDGNMAGASSNAQTGPGGSYQDANAMIANSNTRQYDSSRTQMGNMPPGGPGAGAFAGGFAFPFGTPMFGGGSGSPTGTSASDSSNTGTSSTFTSTSGSDGSGGAFAGSGVGGAFAGPGSVFAGSGAGGAFAGSGGFVGGAVPSFGTGGGVFVGVPPAQFNPFQFVFGPGGFPFGRR